MLYFSFLRAVNVGGHTIKMDELRKLFESLGFHAVETFIASGNVIFESNAGDGSALERTIETALLKNCGYEVATFIRNADEIAAIARSKPCDDARIAAASTFVVGFLKSPLTPSQKKTLAGLRSDADDFFVQGREMYWLGQHKQSESEFSNALFEKKLGLQSTFRGMNTVRRIAEKYR